MPHLRVLTSYSDFITGKVISLNINIDKTVDLILPSGDVESSERTLSQTRASTPEDKARCLKLSSNNAFLLNDFAGGNTNYQSALLQLMNISLLGLDKTIEALEILGLSVNLNPTKEEMDTLFEEVKSSILTIGFEKLLELPRAGDPRVDLTVQLLNVASMDLPRFILIFDSDFRFESP